MSKTCNSCQADKKPSSVPYVVHEAAIARMERIIKRQWVALILAICLLFASFGLFVWYESLYETVTYEQDGGGINNVNLGEQGDLNNGSKGEIQAETQE